MSDYADNNGLNEMGEFEEIIIEEEDDEMDLAESIIGSPVHLVLDDETEMDTIVLDVFSVDNVPWDYIALLPVSEDEEEEEGESDVLLYRFAVGEDGSPELGNIESDAEYEAAADAFYDELDAMAEEEDFPYDEEELEEF